MIEVHGSYHCQISVNNEHTYQAIYFVQTAKTCFISLTACKELNLVHKSFPNQLPTVGVTYPSGSSHPAARRVSAEEHPAARRMSAEEHPAARRASAEQHTISAAENAPAEGHPKQRMEPPMQLREENIGRLQEWFLQQFSSSTFNVDGRDTPNHGRKTAPHTFERECYTTCMPHTSRCCQALGEGS